MSRNHNVTTLSHFAADGQRDCGGPCATRFADQLPMAGRCLDARGGKAGGLESAAASVRGREGGAVQLLNMYPVPRLVSTMVGGTSLSFLRRRRM